MGSSTDRAHPALGDEGPKTMTNIESNADVLNDDCPSCSPHSVSVAQVLSIQTYEDIAPFWETMRWRPHWTSEGRIVLIDELQQEAVTYWTRAEAEIFLQEVLLPGPYGAELVIHLPNEGEAVFMGGHLVALAASLQSNVQVVLFTGHSK